MIKLFSSTFNPGNVKSIKFLPRDLSVDVAKAEFSIDPEELRQTYLAQFMTKGVGRTPQDLPFEKFIFNQVVAKIASELNDTTTYSGVKNSAGTSAIDVTDGFGTILAAMIAAGTNPLVPKTIGALDKTDAVEKLKVLVRSIPAPYRRPKIGLKAYMSLGSYESIEDNLETLGVNTGRGDDMLKPKWVRGSEGVIEIIPASWMANSERVIITPKSNIIMGGDALTQDLGKVNVQEQMWTADIGIAAALGFNFRYQGMIWCNETV